MPLSILLPMVILGIAGIAVLLHVLGLSRRATLSDAAAARAAWTTLWSAFRDRTGARRGLANGGRYHRPVPEGRTGQAAQNRSHA